MDATSRFLQHFENPAFVEQCRQLAVQVIFDADSGEDARQLFATELRRVFFNKILYTRAFGSKSSFMRWAADCMEAELKSVDWDALSRGYLMQAASSGPLSDMTCRSPVIDAQETADLYILEEMCPTDPDINSVVTIIDNSAGNAETESAFHALHYLFRSMVEDRVSAKTTVKLDWLIDAHMSSLLKSGEWQASFFSSANADDIADAVLMQSGIDKEVC